MPKCNVCETVLFGVTEVAKKKINTINNKSCNNSNNNNDTNEGNKMFLCVLLKTRLMLHFVLDLTRN